MARRGKKKSRGGPGCFPFVAAMVIFGIAGIIFFLWYDQQPLKTKERVQRVALNAIDVVREWPGAPDEAVGALDWLADRIPLSVGLALAPGALPEPSPYGLLGLPLSTERLSLLESEGYAVGYDEARKNPAWVAWRLGDPGRRQIAERPRSFNEDRRTRARVRHGDYSGSGYDRGHLAPNYAIGVNYGKTAQMETFLMSNIVPQRPDLNQGSWRRLEKRAADRFSRFEEVWVVAGPIYYDRRGFRRLASGVAIPDAFFKVFVDQLPDGRVRALAFIFPQEARRGARLRAFLATIDEVEAAAGLDLFSALPDEVEARLESHVSERVW